MLKLRLTWTLCRKIVKYHQKVFTNKQYIFDTTAYLGVTNPLGESIPFTIEMLKEAKRTYLEAKNHHQSYRDKYALENMKRSDLKRLRASKKEKQRWKRLCKVFRKKKMKSISTIEYHQDRCLLRASEKFEVEC